MLSRVYHVKLHGNVSFDTFINLRGALKKRLFFKPAVVAVSINSMGGSLVAAKNIARYLNSFALDLEVPLLGFVDDVCFGSANVVLASTYKTYSNPYSMIGDFGSSMTHTSFEDLAKKFDVQTTVIQEGPNKDRLSMWRNLTEEDKELMGKIVKSREQDIRQEVLNYRAKHFRKRGIQLSEVAEKIFDPKNTPEDFVKYGLIDEIATVDEILALNFSNVKKRILINANSKFSFTGKTEAFN